MGKGAILDAELRSVPVGGLNAFQTDRQGAFGSVRGEFVQLDHKWQAPASDADPHLINRIPLSLRKIF